MLLLAFLLAAVFCAPVLAVTEAEVENQVNNAGKESVTGSVLIWFLCALGFLKVSQKIDSFMASLGINVGRTGGSLLGDAMIAMRAVTMIARGGGRGAGGSRSSANSGSAGGAGSSGWFLKGGLAGVAARHVTNSAVKTATTRTSAVNTVASSARQTVSDAAAQSAVEMRTNNETPERDTPPLFSESSSALGAPVQDGVIITGEEGTSIQPDSPNTPLPVSTTDTSPIQTSPSGTDVPPDLTPPDTGIIQMEMPGDNGIPTGSIPADAYPPASDGVQPDVPVSDCIQSDMPVSDGIRPDAPALDGIQPGTPVFESGGSIESPQTPDGIIVTGDSGGMFHMPENSLPCDNSTPADFIPAETSAPAQDGILPDSPPIEGGVPAETPSPQSGIIITGDNSTTLSVLEGGGQTITAQERVTSSERQSAVNRETASRSAQASSTAERTQTHSHTSASHSQAGNSARPSLGGMIFSRSLAAGGSFANNVIGTVARGEVAGSITGDMAAQFLVSYLGHTGMIGTPPAQIPYRDVEIGRGRITGTEIMPEHPGGISFTMYNAAQYAKPEDPFQKVQSADGQTWYKQYAVDTVKKMPFQAPKGKIGYTEEIVKRMPKAPQRKERM